jgi:hypothetical protein
MTCADATVPTPGSALVPRMSRAALLYLVPCSSPVLVVAAIPRAVAVVSGLAKRPRSGLALTRRTRLRSSCSEEDNSAAERIIYHLTVHNLAVSAHASSVDIVARTTAIAAVILALGSLLLTWYQWQHSGAELEAKIEAYVDKQRTGHPDEEWTFTVDVWNKGRMPATVRGVTVVRLHRRWQMTRWISWWFRLIHQGYAFGNEAYPVEGDSLREVKGEFPKEIPPTGYLRARAVMDADLFHRDIRWVRAYIQRGDMRSSCSACVRSPNRIRLPRGIRTISAGTDDD